MRELSESANLFEVNVPDYKQLKACRRLKMWQKCILKMIFVLFL